MLEKELKQSMENLKESKKSMLDISKDMLEMTMESLKVELTFAQDQFNTYVESHTIAIEEDQELQPVERPEEEIATEAALVAEINKIRDKMDLANKEYEEDKAKLEEIGNDITISDSDEFASVLQVIYKIDKDCKSDDFPAAKLPHYIAIKELLQETLSLKKLEDFKPCMSKNTLVQEYTNITRTLQHKIGKDSRFVYPSCFQLKKIIRDIIKSTSPADMNEAELNKRSKIFTSILALHLTKIDIKKEGIYIYYIMQNIYKLEMLPIDDQFTFKKKLMSVLISKLY